MKCDYKGVDLQKIPKKSRISTILRSGNVNFVDITLREDINDNNSEKNIKVNFSTKVQGINFVIQKRKYPGLFDCFDSKNNLIKDYFIFNFCHDIFSNSGVNASRHYLQHIDKNNI